MLAKIRFLLFYFVLWVLGFEVARMVFLIYNYSAAKDLAFSEKLLCFVYGLRMDVSMAAYILVPVCLFVIASIFLSFFRRPIVYEVYTYILLLLVLLISTADLEVYKSWGFRIDTTPLRYLSSPKEAWASVSDLPVFLILFVFLVIYVLLCILVHKLLRKQIHLIESSQKKAGSLLFIPVFTLLLIVPIRGGLQFTPINQSTIYFSKKNFANVTSVNATWNFLYAVLNHSTNKNYYNYLNPQIAEKEIQSLYMASHQTEQILKTTRPNVIVVIWESFTKKATNFKVEGKDVTPYFNELKKRGIYFSNVYASGDRTDKGLAAVLSGYPSLDNFSIIRFPNKSSKLPTLGQFFKNRKYKTSFYYGGEPDFANMKSYLFQNSFDNLVDKSDFASKDLNSKWGAHDGAVAERISNDLKSESSPFFVSWLTLSSHEPFETPVDLYFKAQDRITKFANAMHYSDSVIYHFVQQCSQQPWWQNTLLIIVADHGHHQIPPSNEIENFKIPMLWLGGALKSPGIVVDKYCSQIDIASTLAAQLGDNSLTFKFSKNIFDSTSKPWAYYSFNNGFGFARPQGTFVFDNIVKQIIRQTGTVTKQDIDAGKAMQQETFQDYIDR